MLFEERVRQQLPILSAGQKKAAVYILENLESFSYATLAKLSKVIGVSETTIIRLSYSLGYDSFSQMQDDVRNQLLHLTQDRTEKQISDGPFFRMIFEKEIQALQNLADRLDIDTMEKVCKRLQEADMILSVGARASHNIAEWLGTKLYQLRPNVYVIQQFYDFRMDLLQNLTPSSVVFCISLSRYAKWTYNYACLAKERGACVIALTDSPAAPIAQMADLVLVADSNRNEIGSNSYVSFYCLLNALLAQIQKNNPEAVAGRLNLWEMLNKNFEYYYE